ncbi:HTH-type transcriptional repressor SmtB [Amycolatopsis sp. M39]|nr:HTH-type transcriptional repressor SmtB [Amycolatopsis sp. M39]
MNNAAADRTGAASPAAPGPAATEKAETSAERASAVSDEAAADGQAELPADPPHPVDAGGTGGRSAGSGPAVMPPGVLADAGELLRALAAPVRIAIVLQLREADRCVHELVDELDVAQPLISQHLRVLKTAGVVQGERRGREVVYRLVDDHLAHIVVDAVAHVQEGK